MCRTNFQTLPLACLLLAASLCAAVGASAGAEPRDAATERSLNAAEADGEPLFLEVADVVRRVRQTSPALMVERAGVRRALERSFQERAALLPQLSVGASQTRQKLGRGFGGGSLEAPPFNSFGARLEGRQTVLDAERYANYRIAQLEHAIAELNYEAAEQAFLELAIRLYFTQLRDLRRVEIESGNIERSLRLLKLARDQFEAGATIKIDVTRAEVELARQRRAMMEAETAVEDSMLQLKALLDIPLDRAVLLNRGILEQGIKAPDSLKRYAELQNLSEVRPELVSQSEQVARAQLARKAAAWQQLPSVSLYGEWGYDSDEPFDEEEGEAWLVGIEASIPIFEGGRIAAEKREASAAIRENEARMRELRNDIQREYRFALVAMESRYDQIESARDEVRLGREEIQQAEERYREGLADNRELVDAQQRLAEAESSHLRAIYRYGLARLDFARAVGAAERVLD